MARTVDAAPAPLHVRSVGRRLDRSAPDTRRAGLRGRSPADVRVFAVAASRLLHIAGAQSSVTCTGVVTGRRVLPLEASSESAPAAEGSRAHALVSLGAGGGADSQVLPSPNALEVES